jgi:hypothetical protein
MFVNVHLKALVYGVLREFVVVGEANDIVTIRAVDVIYAIGTKVALVEHALYTCVGMKVSALPAVGGIEATIWVVDVRTTEWAWWVEIIDRTKTCGYEDTYGDKYYHHKRL